VKKSLSFDERLQRLDPLFVELKGIEKELKFPLHRTARFLFKKCDEDFIKKEVKGVLALYFAGKALAREGLKTEAVEKDLKRKIKKIDDLCKENPPDYVLQPLREWRANFKIKLWEHCLGKRAMHGKCPALSEVVTALADALFNCAPVWLRFQKAAEVYRRIGRIINEMTSPSCLVCGRNDHGVSEADWRETRKRDRKREQRLTKHKQS
jgi:hypothetical protein